MLRPSPLRHLSPVVLALAATLVAPVPPTVASPAMAPTASGAAAEPIVITGHGRGHGVGGSIAGYVNRAAGGQTAAGILDFYFPGTSEASLPADASVRVGVYATTGEAIRIAGGGGGACVGSPWSAVRATATGLDMEADEDEYLEVRRFAFGTNVVERFTAAGSLLETQITPGDVTVVDISGGTVRLLDLLTPCFDRYRDQLVVHWSDHGTPATDDDRLWAINAVNIEGYTWGVAEGPADLPVAAADALAITARTYAADKVESSRFKVDGFDISSSSVHLPPGYPGGTQLYSGFDGERPALRGGADRTAFRIRTAPGEGAILAAYSLDAGPVTGDARFEFGTTASVPYLVERRDEF
jgi:stage II sporulation protein D